MDTVLNIGLNPRTVAAMIRLTGDPRFVYDSYRRLIQMFGTVAIGIPDEAFEEKLAACRSKAGVKTDAELKAADLLEYDAIILGSPTYYGAPAAERGRGRRKAAFLGHRTECIQFVHVGLVIIT